MSDLSRRSLLKGLAGVTVVGWSSLNRAWVAAGATDQAGVAPLPPLDGTVETTPEALVAFAGDFGHLITSVPTAVLRPGSVQDIVKMVRYARRHGLTIAMNGQSGTDGQLESHSTFGQAMTRGGIAIDARGLSRIHTVDATSAQVDAGVTWSELDAAAAAIGRTVPMHTDFVHLSIGGTLSVGGIGGTMQRFGAQVDTVTELTVVTGAGDLVTCSPTSHAALFNAVLAGAGQCAIIVAARVELVPAPTHALVFNIFYDDLATYLADQLLVLRDGRFSYQEGQIVRRPDDTGWRYMLEAAAYYTTPSQPDQQALLAGLSDDRPAAVVTNPTYSEWIHRVDPAVAALKAGGFWSQPHPWLSLFLPASRTAEAIGSVAAQLSPADLGAGLVTFFPFDTTKLKRPLLVVPRNERVAFQLSLLRFPFPGQPDIAGLLAQNRAFHDLVVAAGGKRYVIGSVPNMTHTDWRRHYGPLWPAFRAAKQRFDPDTVLTPGQAIFT